MIQKFTIPHQSILPVDSQLIFIFKEKLGGKLESAEIDIPQIYPGQPDSFYRFSAIVILQGYIYFVLLPAGDPEIAHEFKIDITQTTGFFVVVKVEIYEKKGITQPVKGQEFLSDGRMIATDIIMQLQIKRRWIRLYSNSENQDNKYPEKSIDFHALP